MGEQKKVFFQLKQDEDGYPPVAVESVWAQASAQTGEYVIDNIPFFVRDAAMGDTVRVRRNEGVFWFEKIVCRSKNSLIRVVFFDRESVGGVSDHLKSMGCDIEYSRDHNLLAVSVPGSVLLSNVQLYLQTETAAGRIDYEEAILRQ